VLLLQEQFRSRGITGAGLLELDERELTEGLGVRNEQDVVRIMFAVGMLKDQFRAWWFSIDTCEVSAGCFQYHFALCRN
jgi:hypothetical protein